MARPKKYKQKPVVEVERKQTVKVYRSPVYKLLGTRRPPIKIVPDDKKD